MEQTHVASLTKYEIKMLIEYHEMQGYESQGYSTEYHDGKVREYKELLERFA